MKKVFITFVLTSCFATNFSWGAVTIKKAAPVATQESSVSSTTASLVPNVLSLVSEVQDLSAKQQKLTTECIPSSAEITFVNNIIKEWAKTGAMSAEEVERKLGRSPCAGGSGYDTEVRFAVSTAGTSVCFDNFTGAGNDGMVWEGFPKVGLATRICPDDPYTSACSEREQRTMTDIYEIFNLVDFAEEDYTKQELTMAAKLMDKIETCSSTKLSKKKKEMWGQFLINTMGNVGQKTNTSTIMQSVTNMTQNGVNINSGLSSLGSIASQFLNK